MMSSPDVHVSSDLLKKNKKSTFVKTEVSQFNTFTDDKHKVKVAYLLQQYLHLR